MGTRINWSECVDMLEDLYGDERINQDMLEAQVEFDMCELANEVFRGCDLDVDDLGAL